MGTRDLYTWGAMLLGPALVRSSIMVLAHPPWGAADTLMRSCAQDSRGRDSSDMARQIYVDIPIDTRGDGGSLLVPRKAVI